MAKKASGPNSQVFKATLDVTEFKQALLDMLSAYTNAETKVRKGFRVHIDASSIKAFETAFSKSLKGIEAKSGKTNQLLSNLQKSVSSQTTAIRSLFNELTSAANVATRKTGEAVAQNIGGGAKKAAEQVRTATRDIASALKSLPQGDPFIDRANRMTDSFVRRRAQLRPNARTAFDQYLQANGLDLNDPSGWMGVKSNRRGQQSLYISSQRTGDTRDFLTDLAGTTRQAEQSTRKVKQALDKKVRLAEEDVKRQERVNRATAETEAAAKSLARKINSEVGKLKNPAYWYQNNEFGVGSRLGRFYDMDKGGDVLASVRAQRQLENAQVAADIENRRRGGGQAGRVSDLQQAVNANRILTVETGKQAENQKTAARANAAHLASSKGLGASMLQQAATMAKWLIVYRTIRDSMMLIERGISRFVSLGIEYTRNLELQQLGLRAILADNFDVSTADGKRVEGLAAINVLQGESVRQWEKMQQTSLAVVGTTSDLMLLYNSILPHAVKLAGTTDDVQKLVKSAAVAAGLMDISFQDARSAIVSLLQGRYLSRNRLVSVLGFSRQELSQLAGTPQLLQKVQASLDAFNDVAGDAQNTLVALTESWSEFIGKIGSEAIAPFVSYFKQLVGTLQNSLFANTEFGLKLKPETAAFFSFLRTAVKEVTEPIRTFGAEVSKTASNDLPLWIVGLKNVLKVLSQFAQWIVAGSMAVATFIARHQTLLKHLAMLAGFVIVLQFLRNMSAAMLGMANAGGLLGNIFTLLLQRFPAFAGQLSVGTTAAMTARTALASLGATMKMVAATSVIGLLLLGIGKLISRFYEMKQAADDAAAAKRAALGGDQGDWEMKYQTSLAEAKTPQAKAQIINDSLVPRIKTSMGELQNITIGKRPAGLKVDNIFDSVSRWRAEIAKLSDEYKNLAGVDSDVAQQRRLSIRQELGDYRMAEQALLGWVSNLEQLGSHKKDVDSVIGSISQIVGPEQADGITKLAGGISGFFGGGAQNLQNLRSALSGVSQQFAGLQKLGLMTRDDFDQAGNVGLSGKFVPEPKELKGGNYSFQDVWTPLIHAAQEDVGIAQAEWKAKLRTSEISLQAYTANMKKSELDLLNFEVAMYEGRLKAYDDYVVKENARRAGKNKKGISSPEEVKQRGEFDADYQRAQRRKVVKVTDLEADEMEAIKEADQFITAWNTKIAEKVAEIYGDQTAKAVEQINQMQNELHEKLRNGQLSLQQRINIHGQIGYLEGQKGPAASKESAEMRLKTSEQALQTAGDAERLLAQQLDAGAVSMDDYMERVERLRAAERAAIEEQIRQTIILRNLEAGRGANANLSAIDQLNNKLDQLRANLAEIDSLARKASDAFAAWGNFTGNLNDFLSIFEGLGGGVKVFADAIQSAVSRSGALAGTVRSFQNFQMRFSDYYKSFRNFDTGGAGGGSALGQAWSGAKAFGGMFSGIKGGMPEVSVGPQLGTGEMLGNSPASASAIAKMNSGASKMASAIPMIGTVISGALAIGTALFQRAVKKAKEDIKKRFEDISDAMEEGSLTMGQGLSAMEKQRQDLVSKYSSSKSGRSALKDSLDGVDDQIQSLKNRIKDVREAFEFDLKKQLGGGGPFGDFYRQLLDLEKSTKDYLDSFDQATDPVGYAAALKNVNELYEISLKNARASWEEAMLGYEGEALSAQEKYFGLLDEQQSIYKQLSDLADQRADLEKEANELVKDRNDKLQKEAELRKKLADIMRDAAEQEADIRRRGVLEAQLSVAEQKANEIRKVRDKAREELDATNKQLQDSLLDHTLDVGGERETDLAKKRTDLDDQAKQLEEALKMNAIRTAGARVVANIEAAEFGWAANKFDLAQRQAAIEAQAANMQVWKWSETAKLIDAITSKDGRLLFAPPPGFPQIHVHIGNITVDNTSNTVNNTQNNSVNGIPGGSGNGRDREGRVPGRGGRNGFSDDMRRGY